MAHPQTRKRAWFSSRWLWLLVPLAAIPLLYRLQLWWISPEHRMSQFVAAAGRGDTRTMLQLVDPGEVQHLGLTPEKLTALFADAAASRDGLHLRSLEMLPLNERQHRYNRQLQIQLFTRDGRVLPGPTGQPARATVVTYKTEKGWKVAVSDFVYGIMIARHGWTDRKARFAGLCERHGIAPAIFWPEDGQWEQLRSRG